MVDDADADQEGQESRHGQSETVEHREEAESGVVASDLQRVDAGALVADDIAV